eukprot:TRINITY_DN2295_c0_g1_i1.p1 TRINITY_DN2295_c0_g1~~TRINITY_DN2295_c0_g1_i1.p1  ORF type:complete len:381 (+),score=95.78 TRINITY_DN2295_c0_g1_i1:101-1243(+)
MRKIAQIFFVMTHIFGTLSANNGLGITPQMGWNSWNNFGCSVNETVIRNTVDLFLKYGLNELGYKYINIDDCWAVSRDRNGTINPDPKAFPSGMKTLGNYIHDNGMKFGIYSDAGQFTCAGRPGSLGFEWQDAQQYADWGVDYLKYDNCFASSNPEPRYKDMSKALNVTGRPIFYSICDWGLQNPSVWGKSLANSWRTTQDIGDDFNSMMFNIMMNDYSWQTAGPGGWNDPDMLEIGNGGMSDDEYTTHFSLWCITKAPLILGCDLSTISNAIRNIITNEEAIAVNQDPLGVQGRIVDANSARLIWGGPLSDGSTAVVIVALHPPFTLQTFHLDFYRLFKIKKAKIRDLWLKKDVGTFTANYQTVGLRTRQCAFLKLVPV